MSASQNIASSCDVKIVSSESAQTSEAGPCQLTGTDRLAHTARDDDARLVSGLVGALDGRASPDQQRLLRSRSFWRASREEARLEATRVEVVRPNCERAGVCESLMRSVLGEDTSRSQCRQPCTRDGRTTGTAEVVVPGRFDPQAQAVLGGKSDTLRHIICGMRL